MMAVVFVIIVLFTIINTNRKVNPETQSQEITSETVIDKNKDSEYSEDASFEDEVTESNYDEDDYSWMIPQADHENFTDEEKKQIEADTLMNVTDIWELYENVTIDESLSSFSSRIVGFTKEQRIAVLDALGSLGLVAVTDDADTQNGEVLKSFYDDYINGKPGMVTIYKVYEDGAIGSLTFLYRDEEIQSYYVGVRPGRDGRLPAMVPKMERL